MPAHDLGKIWKSQVNGDDDAAGPTFDLTNMSPTGDASNCSHGPNHISGVTQKLEIPEAPAAKYLVQIDQKVSALVRLQYRGVAIYNPATSQINKIVGVKRIIRFPFAAPDEAVESRKQEKAVDLQSQEEGTWVGTQP
jgi:hypothetical protein